MIRFINYFHILLDKLSKVLSLGVILTYTMIILAITIQVFARYVMNSPTVWSEELAIYSFIWLAMLNIPLAIRRKKHASLDILKSRFSTNIEVVFETIRFVLVMIILIVFVYYGFKILGPTGRHISPALRIPFSYACISVPVGAICSVLFELENYFTYFFRSSKKVG